MGDAMDGVTGDHRAVDVPADDGLTRLFNEHYHPMVRLAAWLLGSQAAGEDVVQEAFVRLQTSSTDFSALDSAAAYLRTTVVNLTRSTVRRRKLADRFRPDRLPQVPGPEEFLADEELAAAVQRLSRRQRECVVLRYSQDLTVDQIAAVLGTRPGSVKTHLHRALANLAAALDRPQATADMSAPSTNDLWGGNR